MKNIWKKKIFIWNAAPCHGPGVCVHHAAELHPVQSEVITVVTWSVSTNHGSPEEVAETVRHEGAGGAVTGRQVVAHRAHARPVHHVEPGEEKYFNIRQKYLNVRLKYWVVH